jgi:hypothetical protein
MLQHLVGWDDSGAIAGGPGVASETPNGDIRAVK